MSTPAAWVVVTGATALLMPRMHFDVGCCGVVIGIHYFTILETILVHIVYVCLTSAFFRTWQSSGVHIPPMYAPTAINTARLQLKKQNKKSFRTDQLNMKEQSNVAHFTCLLFPLTNIPSTLFLNVFIS